jgi:hypothetical protein
MSAEVRAAPARAAIVDKRRVRLRRRPVKLPWPLGRDQFYRVAEPAYPKFNVTIPLALSEDRPLTTSNTRLNRLYMERQEAGVAGCCWRRYIQPAFGSTPNTPTAKNTPFLNGPQFKSGHYLAV